MIDIQEKLSEQFEQLSQYQKDALSTLQAKGAASVDTFEKLARFNLAVLADAVDFSVEQAKLATSEVEPSDYINKQIENASAFGEVVQARTQEYVEMLTSAAEAARGSQEVCLSDLVRGLTAGAGVTRRPFFCG
jgi:hypothetical protein